LSWVGLAQLPRGLDVHLELLVHLLAHQLAERLAVEPLAALERHRVRRVPAVRVARHVDGTGHVLGPLEQVQQVRLDRPLGIRLPLAGLARRVVRFLVGDEKLLKRAARVVGGVYLDALALRLLGDGLGLDRVHWLLHDGDL
jgi:hypothetical protein